MDAIVSNTSNYYPSFDIPEMEPDVMPRIVPYVTVIADNVSSHTNPNTRQIETKRITSFIIHNFPKWLVAELNTHRLFSRNSASSRAIPVSKIISNITDNPFVPYWRSANSKGMQQGEFITDTQSILKLDDLWLDSMKHVVECVEGMQLLTGGNGVAKEITNRVLEPWMTTTIMLTATDFQNFLKLRNSEFAQLEIRQVASSVANALDSHIPKQCEVGDYHVPFGDNISDEMLKILKEQKLEALTEIMNNFAFPNLDITAKIVIATARAARVSYKNFDGTNDPLKDMALFSTLLDRRHSSPFEHIARVMTQEEFEKCVFTEKVGDKFVSIYGVSGNFSGGWLQLRKMLNRQDRH